MFKIIFGLIFKLRDWLQGKVGKLFDAFRDESTGKVTFAKPGSLKYIFTIAGLILFFVILSTQIFTSTNRVSGGMEAFQKEIKPNSGIGSRDLRQGALEDDPFKSLGSITRDQFGENAGFGGSGVTGVLDPDAPLAAGECLVVLDKMKQNAKLSVEEEILAERCVTENPMGMTGEELNFAKAMLDPATSDAERALLAKALAGTATESELAVARALTSGNPEQVAQAKAAVALGQEAINVLGKQLAGQPLTDAEKRILAQINEAAKSPLDRIAGQAGQLGAAASDVLGGIASTANLPPEIAESSKPLALPSIQAEAIKALSQDVANREELIKQLDGQIAQEQLQVSPSAEKLAAGQQLNAPETQRLQDFTRRKQQIEDLKRLQETRKTEFAKRAATIQTSLAQAILTVQKSLPTGTFIEYEGNPLTCVAQSLPVKKRVRAVVAKNPPGTILDVDGRPIRPEEVEFIKLHRKNQFEISRLDKDAKKGPDLGNLGQQVNIAALAGEGGPVGIADIKSLFVFQDSSIQNFELTPDMKIPAVVDSEILVSDKGKGQMVRFRILADVHNPRTNQIVIPKGSIATAMTGGFDNDTGIMDLTVERAVVGAGRMVTVRLLVGSADGSVGLRGQIRDTTGKYLAGAFITAFSAGALSWFSQQVVAPFQTSTQAGQALSGAGLAGGAEVLTKISEIYAAKLQNASTIYWVPRGIPVVLFPN